jgi:hypothetical protein
MDKTTWTKHLRKETAKRKAKNKKAKESRKINYGRNK